MNMFRTLRADEIDCRISQIKEQDGEIKGLTLLLYKDARCDQNILDEVAGPFKWKREHSRDNRNCTVSIWSDELQQWISKEDTGTESNTEKEKGLASDSFKRACFNWGIGRELYTAPFIWIPASKCNISKNKYGKSTCYDNFTVTEIDYLDGNICFLTIKNEKTGKECYRYGEKGKQTERSVEPDSEPSTPAPINVKHDAPADVTITDKLPGTIDTDKPSEMTMDKAFNSNMTEFMQRFEITDRDEALKKFNDIRQQLQKAGIVPKGKKMKDVAELNSTFDAIYKNINPSGDAA